MLYMFGELLCVNLINANKFVNPHQHVLSNVL